METELWVMETKNPNSPKLILILAIGKYPSLIILFPYEIVVFKKFPLSNGGSNDVTIWSSNDLKQNFVKIANDMLCVEHSRYSNNLQSHTYGIKFGNFEYPTK